MSDTAPAPWRTWLQLLRAPNLFTVPGDPLAGFLLATAGHLDLRLPLAIVASLCFYSHGLLLNDLADLAEDRRDRPQRPLPSGAASAGVVLVVAINLALLGLALCCLIDRGLFIYNYHTLYVGMGLLASIVAYNLWLKKIPVVGPITMGLCRGFSVLLGATAGFREVFAEEAVFLQNGIPREITSDGNHVLVVWSTLLPLALFAAIGVTVYIAAVTHLARIETLADPPKLPRTLPFFTLVIVIVAFFVAAIDRTQPLRYTNIWLYLIGAYTLYAGYKIHHRLTRQPPPPIPPIIGQLIRLLLPLQAIFCLASRSLAGAVSAIALLVLWPISKSVSRRFYAS